MRPAFIRISKRIVFDNNTEHKLKQYIEAAASNIASDYSIWGITSLQQLLRTQSTTIEGINIEAARYLQGAHYKQFPDETNNSNLSNLTIENFKADVLEVNKIGDQLTWKIAYHFESEVLTLIDSVDNKLLVTKSNGIGNLTPVQSFFIPLTDDIYISEHNEYPKD